MACDIILAADTAVFGQPEITLGIMPGNGGTQRLTRAVGKAKAMELCLTGRRIDAEEAERSNLVSRVVPAAELLDEAMKVADKIANLSQHAVMMIKEAINRGFATTLAEGLALRARPVLLAVRHRRPERGHGRLHREAEARLHEPLGSPRYWVCGGYWTGGAIGGDARLASDDAGMASAG